MPTLRFFCRHKKPRARLSHQSARRDLQTLERRLALSAVAWNGPNGGAWDVASNWNGGAVPGPSDDVTIDTSAAATITIESGDTIAVKSLATGGNDTLAVSGGSLAVSDKSTLSGPLVMTSGSLTASGPLTTFTADGSTSLSGASLHALGGATLSLPQLTGYTSNSTTLEAVGGGSVLSLARLASVAIDGSLTINADNGGQINLGSLTSLSGNATPSALQINDVGNSRFVDPSLGSLDFVNATLDGSDVQAATSWTRFTHGSLSVTGGKYGLPGLVDLDGSSLNLSGGALVTLPAMTTGATNSVSLAGRAGLDTTGDFTNNGTLTVDAGSKLNVGGSFAQSSSGTLNVQLGGPSAGGLFGQIAVQNAATLAGTLNVAVTNGYVPQNSDDFKVMLFTGAVGNFAAVTGLTGPLTEIVNPTSVDLSPPPDAVESLVGVPVNTAIGINLGVETASFSDGNPAAQASEFGAVVDWGDGTTSGGYVNGGGGQFQVGASHDYSHAGSFTVTTTVVVQGIATSATSSAMVSPALGGRVHVTTSDDTHASNPASSPVDPNGNISLRSAIEYLNTGAPANDTIDFDANNVRGPVQLTLGPIEIDASLTIDGSSFYQLAVNQAAGGDDRLLRIDALDGNKNPVAVTVANLTLNLAPLTRNNAAPFDNSGSLTFNNVNLVTNIAYSPAIGDSVAFVSAGGQLADSLEINGVTINQSDDDAALNENSNVYPFKANYSAGGLSLSFDANPTIRVGASSAQGDDIVVAQSRQVSAGDVVADWRFQEGAAGQPATSPIVDSSANALNGTPINGPIYSSNVAFGVIPQTGQPDKVSLEFNGTNQRVFVPDNPQFQLTHSLTLEALVYVTAAAQNYRGYILFRGDDRGQPPYTLDVDGFGTNLLADFNISDGSGGFSNVIAPLPGLNQWLDIAGTLDDATGAMRLYINGIEVASTATTVRPFAALDPAQEPGLGIGDIQSAIYNSYFEGLINEVRICDVALTPDQLLGSTARNFVVSKDGNPLLNEPASNLAMLTLDGGGGDTFDMTPEPAFPIVVHGGAAGTSGGDTLVLPQSGNLSQTFDPASGYSGTWSSNSGQTITFSGIQTLELKQHPFPTSSVAALPATETSTQFTVSWSGSDTGGPGVASYDVYVSDDGGPPTAFQTNTTATSATFSGLPGHTYGFYSVATDTAGNVQPVPTAAQTTTQVAPAVPTAVNDTFVLSSSRGASSGAGDTGVLYNAVSADGQPLNLRATLVSTTSHGSLTLNRDGSFTYTPNSTFQGIDRFSYQVSEGSATGNTVTVTLLSSTASTVDKLYHQVLGRAAEDAGLSYWTAQLDSGQMADVVAKGIFNSVERLDPLVAQLYEKLLHRGTDAGGLAYWVADWQTKGDPDDVVVNILASQEFYDDAGETHDGFVRLLYSRFLGRAYDSAGLGYWDNLLDTGQLTVSQAAAAFRRTHEQHVDLVDFLFGEYFNGSTPPDPTAYVAQLDAGSTQTQVEQAIIDSDAYRNTPSPPAPGTVGKPLYEH